MKKKTIELIVSPGMFHFVGDGFRVHNFIPSTQGMSMERMNPFILLDYNSPYYFPASDIPRGVGVHPHRGFETVTIAYKGRVEHHDSAGNGGVIREGDVQWMTAAKGVLHKEFHEKEWSRKGGEFHMVQLWVNLPAKDKASEPKYQAIENSKMKRYPLDRDGGEMEIIAGEYKGIQGNAFTFTPVHLFNARLKKGAKVEYQFPSHFNTGLLVVEGEIKVNDSPVPTDHFVLMANDGEEFIVEATEDAIVLVLSGEPIREPIVSRGPFVMNTKEEIKQAYEDFYQDKFGYLED